MIRGDANPGGTNRFKNANGDALIAFIRLLAIQQARQDREEQQDAEARRDLCEVFLGSAK